MPEETLRKNPMMAHLLDALNDGKDIGHYGRLVFVMVARHFMDDEELVATLSRGDNCTPDHALALVRQVQERDYSPPRRERILEYARQQDFPLWPDGADPDACNVYRDLQFPEHVYAHIAEYRDAKAQDELSAPQGG